MQSRGPTRGCLHCIGVSPVRPGQENADRGPRLMLVNGFFEPLRIRLVVFGSVDSPLAEALQHFTGARQFRTGNLSLRAPQARTDECFGTLRVDALDANDQHRSW